uniref:Uncharacterized protein n=1 Tax=Octopus bimaculoides TaxID=37653 RepID=A0A0L8GLC1_OCTBM
MFVCICMFKHTPLLYLTTKYVHLHLRVYSKNVSIYIICVCVYFYTHILSMNFFFNNRLSEKYDADWSATERSCMQTIKIRRS